MHPNKYTQQFDEHRMRLAIQKYKCGVFHESYALAKQALDLRQNVYGMDALESMQARELVLKSEDAINMHAAVKHFSAGEYARAKSMALDVWVFRKSLYGASNVHALHARNLAVQAQDSIDLLQAVSKYDDGKIEEARALTEKVFNFRVRFYGLDSPMTLEASRVMLFVFKRDLSSSKDVAFRSSPAQKRDDPPCASPLHTLVEIDTTDNVAGAKLLMCILESDHDDEDSLIEDVGRRASAALESRGDASDKPLWLCMLRGAVSDVAPKTPASKLHSELPAKVWECALPVLKTLKVDCFTHGQNITWSRLFDLICSFK